MKNILFVLLGLSLAIWAGARITSRKGWKNRHGTWSGLW